MVSAGIHLIRESNAQARDVVTRRHAGSMAKQKTRSNQSASTFSASERHRVTASSLVAIVMGSKSDWETMRAASDTGRAGAARHLGLAEFAGAAESRGIEVIIAAAGGAAHLAGIIAAHTTLPVLGVPMKSDALNGLDSLLSTVQMPAGIPVGTLAIGKPGATNAALFAIAILANKRVELKQKLKDFRAAQEKKIRETKLD